MEVSGRAKDLREEARAHGLCTPCLGEGEEIMADSFCTVCNELLCELCGRAHSRAKVSKGHELLYGDDIPPKPVETLKENVCQKHGNKLFEFYCKAHDCFCCPTCFAQEHQGCCWLYIDELSHGILTSEPYLVASRELGAMIDRLEEASIGKRDHIMSKYEEFVADIKQFKAEIMSVVDDLEMTTIKGAQVVLRDIYLQEDNLLTMNSRVILSNTRRFAKAMEDQRDYKQFRQLVITTRNAGRQLSECRGILDRLRSSGSIDEYLFEPHRNALIHSLQDVKGLGSFTEINHRFQKDRQSHVKKGRINRLERKFEIQDMGKDLPRHFDPVYEKQSNSPDQATRDRNESAVHVHNHPKPNNRFSGTNASFRGQQKRNNSFPVQPIPCDRAPRARHELDEYVYRPKSNNRCSGTNSSFRGHQKQKNSSSRQPNPCDLVPIDRHELDEYVYRPKSNNRRSGTKASFRGQQELNGRFSSSCIDLDVQQIDAFQRNPHNCSLNQAAVTRSTLKSDEISTRRLSVGSDEFCERPRPNNGSFRVKDTFKAQPRPNNRLSGANNEVESQPKRAGQFHRATGPIEDQPKASGRNSGTNCAFEEQQTSRDPSSGIRDTREGQPKPNSHISNTSGANKPNMSTSHCQCDDEACSDEFYSDEYDVHYEKFDHWKQQRKWKRGRQK